MTKVDKIRKPIVSKPSASLTEAQIKNQTINFSLKNPYCKEWISKPDDPDFYFDPLFDPTEPILANIPINVMTAEIEDKLERLVEKTKMKAKFIDRRANL